MKPPNAQTPSGDRTIARYLMQALKRIGGEVEIASEFRTWMRTPGAAGLSDLRLQAEREITRILAAHEHGRKPRPNPALWVTYHVYYKAPDLIGPRISKALAIPYVIIEGSYASHRKFGPWHHHLAEAEGAIRSADAIFSLTRRDRRGLLEICDESRLHQLAPFIDLSRFAGTSHGSHEMSLHQPSTQPARPVRLVTVAMMRHGAKQQSYQALHAALAERHTDNWTLDIIGDGEARGEVADLFSQMSERTRFHGALPPPDIQRILSRSDIFVWPGVDEAIGMAYLEAQALGLPVVALATAGVPEVVRHGETGLLASPPTPSALALCLAELIAKPTLRQQLATAATQHVQTRHSLEAAASHLARVLRPLMPPQ